MLIDTVERLIREKPGCTATQLAQALFGLDGYQERVSPACRALCACGRVRRQGNGGPGDPYRYFATTD